MIDAYFHENEPSAKPPSLFIGCFAPNAPVELFFHTGGPRIVGKSETGFYVGLSDDPLDPMSGWLTPYLQADDYVAFDTTQTFTLVTMMLLAEVTDEPFVAATLHEEGRAVGAFYVDGFTTNYWRLPCAE